MQAVVLKPVPIHLTAEMTCKTECRTDIVKANEMLDKIYYTLEQERDFPLHIGWPSTIIVNKRRKNIIKQHLEAVGYIVTFDNASSYESIILSVPPEECEIKNPIKKQKIVIEDVSPPKYQ
jgi:hypothetical protein